MKSSRLLLLVSLIAVSIFYVNRSSLIRAKAPTGSKAITLTPVHRRDRATAEERGFYPLKDWMATPWTGNDKPFLLARTKIDQLSEQNKLTQTVLTQCKQAAQKNPKDPVAQFQWGYAYYKARNDGLFPSVIAEDQANLLDIAWSLVQAPSPRSYEYTRLQFLIYAQDTVAFLSPAGGRLLRHSPEDYEVECYFYPSLMSSSVPGSRQKALAGALNLVKRYPKRGGPYSTLGDIYAANWLKGDVKSGPLAVEAFQKYLSMPPKGLTPRAIEGLKHWMNFIRTHPQGPKGSPATPDPGPN